MQTYIHSDATIPTINVSPSRKVLNYTCYVLIITKKIYYFLKEMFATSVWFLYPCIAYKYLRIYNC